MRAFWIAVLATAIFIEPVSACQSMVSGFDHSGQIRMEVVDGRSQPVFARDGLYIRPQLFPLTTPDLRHGYGNYVNASIDRVELVRVAGWRHDPLLTVAARADSFHVYPWGY